MAMNTAKDRAEEWLHNLQRRGRDLIEAEDGLAKTVRDLIDKQGLQPAEVRRRLEELVGRLKAASVLERVRSSEAVVFLNDYRGGFEKRAEEQVHRLLGSLQIATRTDVEHLSKQVKTLSRKITDLSKRFREN